MPKARGWAGAGLLVLGMLAAGCGQMVTVNAYLDPARAQGLFPGATVRPVSQNQGQAVNPVLDRMVEGKLRVLLTQAMYRPESGDQAEFLLGYQFGQLAAQGIRLRTVYEEGRKVNVTTTGKDGQKVTTTVQEPGRSYQVPETVTNLSYQARLTLYRNQGGRLDPALAVWSAEAASEDTETGHAVGDLAGELDYLLVGAMLYLGQATPQPASVFVKDEHPWLVALRGGR